MYKIQENAKRNVQKALTELSLKLGMKPKDTLYAREYMDDGSFVSLYLTIGELTLSSNFKIEILRMPFLISEVQVKNHWVI
jgi:hypothetical protein